MPVTDRVIGCINKYNSNDLENALIQVCIALDGTAKKEYPKIKKVGERFRAFIKANMDIITFFTFNTNIFINCQFGESRKVIGNNCINLTRNKPGAFLGKVVARAGYARRSPE